MIRQSASSVSQILQKMKPSAEGEIQVVLLGGCSRSGKSTLAGMLQSALDRNGIFSLVLSLDSWLISADLRSAGSTVMDRYEVSGIAQCARDLVRGRKVLAPVYNSKLRQRMDSQFQELQIQSGVLIVEGVIALAIDDLRKLASIRVYVEVEGEIRKKRLVDFYTHEKGFSIDQAREIVAPREEEEVPFVEATRKHADIIYFESD